MSFIQKAKKYYNIAVQEINESRKNHNIEIGVDGCDKAWLSLNLAIKELFVKKGVEPKKLPKSNRGINYFLHKYGDRELRKIYGRAYYILHIQGYYEQNLFYEDIFEVLEDINYWINKIENELYTKG